ncbi:prokineticin domain-containing protein [Caerostris extrusa]|uniref:Prokineticin domain-containing protein n=1 Tax=Caerostris extrusa TaxID=172846 RepID=A0AAV4N1N1_CAEEX|nr:prokineticin domain-containing protein [Caerostris extrusa]
MYHSLIITGRRLQPRGSRRRIRCQGANDCADDECCLARNTVHLIGTGRCTRLGSIGDRCNQMDASIEVYGGKYLGGCPCRQGMSCQQTRRFRESAYLNYRSQRCEREAATTTTTTTATSTTAAPTTASITTTEATTTT